MTITKMTHPKASSALDEQVAIEFLGWKKEKAFYLNETGHITYLVPRFSKSNRLAFRLLLKLRKMGHFCCIDIGSDYHYLWSIKITPGYRLRTLDKHKPLVYFENKSLPLIITNAVFEAARFLKSNSPQY